MTITYIQAIGIGFPEVQCHTFGTSDLYEEIIWDAGAPIPDKTTLDQWIISNPTIIVVTRKITVLAFRNRFTKLEKIKIEMASLDDTSLALDSPQRLMAAALRVDMKDTDNATFIDLEDTDTRDGILVLEQYGLIDPGRALIILDSPVLNKEIPGNKDI